MALFVELNGFAELMACVGDGEFMQLSLRKLAEHFLAAVPEHIFPQGAFEFVEVVLPCDVGGEIEHVLGGRLGGDGPLEALGGLCRRAGTFPPVEQVDHGHLVG